MKQELQPDFHASHDPRPDVPLIVGLEGALIRTDLSVVSAFAALGSHPWRVLASCAGLAKGRAGFRASIADLVAFDPATLPYDENVLALIAQARRDGRPVYLASRADERHARAIAQHLGLFKGTFGSASSLELTGQQLADRLVEAFGANRFDYVGGERDDAPALELASVAILAAGRTDLQRLLTTRATQATVLPRRPYKLHRILDAIRLRQWAKNLLVFVPIVTALQFTVTGLLSAFDLFLAFSLCASAGYVFNDLVDLRFDRLHPQKRQRPFATMDIPLAIGLGLIPLLLGAAIAIAFLQSREIGAIVVMYLVATVVYSVFLKSRLLIDVITLGGLYTLRVFAGSVAIGVMLSGWLLLYCIFIFTALALVKRCSEMTLTLTNGLSDPVNRDYKSSDLPALLALASAAAFSAVVIFALYAQSDAVRPIYSKPQNLLFAVPVLIYWLSRIIILAHRGLIMIDPIVFALRDQVSWACAILMAAIILISI